VEEFDEIMDLLQNQEHTFSVDVSENSMHDSITNALANNIICENNTRNSPYVPVHDFPDDDDDDDDTLDNNSLEDLQNIFEDIEIQLEDAEIHNIYSPIPAFQENVDDFESPLNASSYSVDEELSENEDNDETDENFLGLADFARNYNIQESVDDDIVTFQKNEICCIICF